MKNDDKKDHNQLLRSAWQQFCDEIKASGELVFDENSPDNPITRAAGIRLLARNISLALQFQLENNNAEFPELLHYFDPIRKQGGDNADAHYSGAPINGQHIYRIRGNRGSAKYFAITLLEDGDTPWGGAVVETRLAKDLNIGEDGQFELWIAPEKPADFDAENHNWMQSSTDTYRITFRQFFADWLNEEPMQLHIECLSQSAAAPAFGPLELSEGLAKSVAWLRESSRYWATMIDKWRAQPNRFLSYGEVEKNKIDFTPGGAPLIAYWRVARDEALILRVTPPDASYWSVEFGNYWWETMDYRYRLSGTNCHHATLEADGELIVVISHEDIGAKNWLEPSGHEEGYITYRWIGCDNYPRPVAQQIPLAQLKAEQPELTGHINTQQRRRELAARREGVNRRFGS